MCPVCDFAAQGEFVLSNLLTAQGQRLTIPLSDKHGRPLPGCGAVLSAEQLANNNAVVSRNNGHECCMWRGSITHCKHAQVCHMSGLTMPCFQPHALFSESLRWTPPSFPAPRSSCPWPPPSWRTRTLGARATHSCASPRPGRMGSGSRCSSLRQALGALFGC
jgi:hypothetical protein